MKRSLVGLVTMVLTFTLFALHSDAKKVRVALQAPKMVSAEKAQLRGRVSGRDVVEIQRFAVAYRTVEAVKRVRASAKGVFRTTVRATRRWERYRAVAGTRPQPHPAGARCWYAAHRRDAARTTSAADGPTKDDGSLWSCTLAEDFDGDTARPHRCGARTPGSSAAPTPHDPATSTTPRSSPCTTARLRLSVRKVAEPPVYLRPAATADRARRGDGDDVPPVQPAVRPVRGQDQEHRDDRAPGYRRRSGCGRTTATASAGPGRRLARSTSPRPTRTMPIWRSRSSTTPGSTTGGPVPGTQHRVELLAPLAGSGTRFTLEWTASRHSRSWSTARPA